MGFGAGDEIATVRLDQVEAQMPDVEIDRGQEGAQAALDDAWTDWDEREG